MELTQELTPQLKRLRWSGVLETLELGNQQAIQERRSYVEFLARLIQDEVERRTQKPLQLRVRRAAFRSDKTLESFDFSFNPTTPALHRSAAQGASVAPSCDPSTSLRSAQDAGLRSQHLHPPAVAAGAV